MHPFFYYGVYPNKVYVAHLINLSRVEVILMKRFLAIMFAVIVVAAVPSAAFANFPGHGHCGGEECEIPY